MFRAPNNIFQNWDKDVYIATKVPNETLDEYGNRIITYNTPFYFGKENYQPLTRKDLEAFMQVYGETTNNIVSMLIDYTDDNKFKTYDVAYLYGATPDGEEVNGENANYIVKAYKPQNTKIMVLLQEITKED